ncbi:MAG: methyltransferase [Candidatus Electryonea clarkiae]|nr:methyltransferase [Candidatus Electryonea clarkiae]MDP8285872.1 methyltransferase [Candidatus Electryonea clarkiae]
MNYLYEIYDLTSDGRGVAKRPDGRIVLIDGGLPGDHVIVTISKDPRRGPISARIEEVLVPSRNRIPHPCPHYVDGCAASPLGALRYSAALEWKCLHLKETLIRIGKITDPNISSPIPSPEIYEYRDRLELRLLLHRGKRVLAYSAFSKIIPIKDCCIGVKSVRNALNDLSQRLEEGLLPDDDVKWSRGLRLFIRDNGRGEAVAVLFVVARRHINVSMFEPWMSSKVLAGWQVRRVSSMKSRFWQSNVVGKSGNALIYQKVGNYELMTEPTVFSQANHATAKIILEKVLDKISDNGNLLDIYGGYGFFALHHALRGGKATVVESSHEAVLAGRKFARKNNLQVQYIEGNLAKRTFFKTSLSGFDSVILDPPRRGAHAVVIDILNEYGPDKLIYVSCHPATLARDLARLDSYECQTFIPVDLFPQTSALETIAVLQRKNV